jgi:hypothetical protein
MLGVGVPMDSQNFRKRLQKAKSLRPEEFFISLENYRSEKFEQVSRLLLGENMKKN